MDNPSTLADFLEHERDVIQKATADLWDRHGGVEA